MLVIFQGQYGRPLNFGEGWTANQSFLDTALDEGYSIYRATVPGDTGYWLEMRYLMQQGINPASLPVVTVPH